MKLFLDTNILVDYYSQRKPFFENAVKLRIAAMFEDVELWTSVQSFQDVEYILRKAIPIHELRLMMKQSLEFFHVANSHALDLTGALDSQWPDLEDFMIAECARRIKADYIVTRDRDGFADSSIPVISPKDFFIRLEEDQGISYEEIDL